MQTQTHPKGRSGDRQPLYFKQEMNVEIRGFRLSLRVKSVGKYTFVQILDKIFFGSV